MSYPRIILASESPRRHELLNLIRIPHEIIPARVNEQRLTDEAPATYAERLAREKAAVVGQARPDAVVIGADTIVVIDGDVLEKPAGVEDAKRMLRRLGGYTHRVMTGVAVCRESLLVSGVETVDVRMRCLSDEETSAYVATGEPMDKAGAYGIQGFGAVIVERIDGDFFAVMGLALGLLVDLLRLAGVAYEFAGKP